MFVTVRLRLPQVKLLPERLLEGSRWFCCLLCYAVMSGLSVGSSLTLWLNVFCCHYKYIFAIWEHCRKGLDLYLFVMHPGTLNTDHNSITIHWSELKKSRVISLQKKVFHAEEMRHMKWHVNLVSELTKEVICHHRAFGTHKGNSLWQHPVLNFTHGQQ